MKRKTGISVRATVNNANEYMYVQMSEGQSPKQGHHDFSIVGEKAELNKALSRGNKQLHPRDIQNLKKQAIPTNLFYWVEDIRCAIGLSAV